MSQSKFKYVSARASLAGLGMGMLSILPIGMASPAHAVTCDPAVHVLPVLPGHVGGRVQAMNDRGWVVGSSQLPSEPHGGARTATLWRGNEEPVDLGIGGGLQDDGSLVYTSAVDVNEDGVVAIIRQQYGPGETSGLSAFVWEDGEATSLPRGRRTNDASVAGINDRGVAVGSIAARAVIWRDGNLIRLPVPRGAWSVATDINNFGLVVGVVVRRGTRDEDPWYWRIGGGSGPLPVADHVVGPMELDNGDRIAFSAGRSSVLLRGPHAKARPLPHRHITAMNDSGDVVGYDGGFRGFGDTAWVGRLFSGEHELPAPVVNGVTDWDNTLALAVVRGTTDFAPQGGVSVGGVAQGSDDWPIIWTCTPTS